MPFNPDPKAFPSPVFNLQELVAVSDFDARFSMLKAEGLMRNDCAVGCRGENWYLYQ